MQDLQYDERLKQLGLMRLERRRVRSDLIETFKIMNGVYDIIGDLFFQLDEGGRTGHDQKLFKKRFRLNIIVNILLATELLITGTRYLQIVFIVKLLIL